MRFNEMPVLRLELDRLKTNVNMMLSDYNEEFSNVIKSEIETQLSEDWIRSEIRRNVRECITEALSDIGDDYRLRSLITEGIVNCLVDNDES